MSRIAQGQEGEYGSLLPVREGDHIHMVGIGGSGMSAIARVLLEQGKYRISGSDRALSEAGRSLSALGAEVHDGHRAEQVRDADWLFVSSAIPADNAEVQAARGRGIPVIKRPQVLAWLTHPYRTIAIAGTHGKTTTTAMIARILLEAGLDPSFVIGGVVPELGTNARAGAGPYFVIEADEYDRTFLELRPSIAIVTNVEHDHPDCYATYADVLAAFGAFVQGSAADGRVVACGDDPGAVQVLAGVQQRRTLTYGLGAGCDMQATALQSSAAGHEFVFVARGESRGRFELALPGMHNLRNGLAALTVAQELDLDLHAARDVLRTFRGAARRFELKGEANGVTVIDDYAHHPTEIRVTLAAARERYGGRAIWAVFQPHTFSRTQALLDQYQKSFEDADHVLVTPIYASREHDDHRVSSEDLVRHVRHNDIHTVPDLAAAVTELAARVQAGDVVVIMGAGDSYRVGEGVLSELQERIE